MRSRTWSEEEVAVLRDTASSRTVQQLADELDRSVKAVRWELVKLGLKAADGRGTPEARERVSKPRVEHTDTEQRCSAGCGQWKPFADFCTDRSYALGVSTRCKQCASEKAQQKRENVPGQREKERAAGEAWRRRQGIAPAIKYQVGADGRECTACRKYKPWSEFNIEGNPRNAKCNPCWREHVRKTRYARQYGITIEDYELLEQAQGGACFLCGEQEGTEHFRTGTRYYLSIDHAHDCGRHAPELACKFCIRGLLCGRCNRTIGGVEAVPSMAARFSDYLPRRPLL